MTSPAELQAIRERDARWLPHRPQNTVADYDRRTLLALYDAQSDQVRRLREALKYVRLQVILMRKEGSMKQLDMESLRDRIEEALGSQP